MGASAESAFPLTVLCALKSYKEPRLTYFSKGIEKTQLKRDHKAALLESVRTGSGEPAHGMTKDEAVRMLVQDIADYDEILARLRRHGGS